MILPIMIGHTIAIYNGLEHIPLLISDQMIGHLCYFFYTNNFFKSINDYNLFFITFYKVYTI